MRYLIALSFRGQQRGRAKRIALALKEKIGSDNVFFDSYEDSTNKPAGGKTDESLKRLESVFKSSLLSVVLMCENYFSPTNNKFCKHEYSLIKRKQDWERVYFQVSILSESLKNEENLVPIDAIDMTDEGLVLEVEKSLLIAINTKYGFNYSYSIYGLIKDFKEFIVNNKQALLKEDYKHELPLSSYNSLFSDLIEHLLEGKKDLSIFLSKVTFGFPEKKIEKLEYSLRGVKVGTHRNFKKPINTIYIEIIEDNSFFTVRGHTEIQSEVFYYECESISTLRYELPTLLRKKIGRYSTSGKVKIDSICFVVSDYFMDQHIEKWADDQGSIYEMSPNFYRKSYSRIENMDYYADTWRLVSLKDNSCYSVNDEISNILIKESNIFEVISSNKITSKAMKNIRNNLRRNYCGFFVKNKEKCIYLSDVYKKFVPSVVIYPLKKNKKYIKYFHCSLKDVLNDKNFHDAAVIYYDFYEDVPINYINNRLKN